ncbi:hypothetical protein CI238_08818, partial [Colletotrichum incanum]
MPGEKGKKCHTFGHGEFEARDPESRPLFHAWHISPLFTHSFTPYGPPHNTALSRRLLSSNEHVYRKPNLFSTSEEPLVFFSLVFFFVRIQVRSIQRYTIMLPDTFYTDKTRVIGGIEGCQPRVQYIDKLQLPKGLCG